jgi:hypothetical protein
MVWVVAYAGWSLLIGFVIAAVTGEQARTISPGASALFYVIGPLVPTIAALIFNDWARDGFPTREQRARRAGRRRGARGVVAAGAPPTAGDTAEASRSDIVDPGLELAASGEPAVPGDYPVAPLIRE